MTERAARSAGEVLSSVGEAGTLLATVYPFFKPWRLGDELTLPPDLMSLEPWEERTGIGAGTWLVGASVDCLETAFVDVWQNEDFHASVALLEKLRESPGRTMSGGRHALTSELVTRHRRTRKTSFLVQDLLGRASAYQFRYEELKSEADRIPGTAFHQGSPSHLTPPGDGDLGNVAGCLTATWKVLEQMSGTFHRLAREGFVDKSPALAYVDAMTAAVEDPDASLWGSPQRMARKLKDITNDLDFRAEGCAMVNTAVIESLKGRPTVPTRRPGAGETWPRDGAKQLYGKEGATVYGMDELTRHLTAKAKAPGDLFHVQMVGKKIAVGHAVTVLRTNRGFLYVDVGLGGCRRKVTGLLATAQWQERGFDVFTVTYAGQAADHVDLDADPAS
ncbi:hypothetical protein [Streptomyces sp. NPDC089919]|uniref:hypothetical protein n=1 Tax=Streptomyces sp. NPDC089919 TaxID=3155188 RepID=UPI00341C00A4